MLFPLRLRCVRTPRLANVIASLSQTATKRDRSTLLSNQNRQHVSVVVRLQTFGAVDRPSCLRREP